MLIDGSVELIAELLNERAGSDVEQSWLAVTDVVHRQVVCLDTVWHI